MTLRETLGRIAKFGTPPNEEAAKFQIIVPVLSDLGWDVYNSQGTSEVRFEHSAGGSRGGGRVDIALMGRQDQCACFVEAKSPGVNLDDHVAQLLGYAFHDGVTVCVLTDGLEWRLYLPREAGKPEARQFARLRLQEDPIEQSADDLEAFLSRDAVRSGKAERDAAKVLKRLQEESDIARRLPEIWRKMLTKPDVDLVELVRTKVYAELRLSPSAEQVASVLSGEEVAPSRPTSSGHGRRRGDRGQGGGEVASSRQAHSGEPAGHAPTPRSPKKVPAKSQKIVGATVLGVYKELSIWRSMWIFVVEQMYDRHEPEFWKVVTQFKGRTRNYISKNNQGMTRPHYIESLGFFVETNLSAESCGTLSRRMLKLFGHSESDLQIHNG